jgi:hypothetical protein
MTRAPMHWAIAPPKSARGLMKQVWDARLLGNHNSNKTPKRLPTLHSTTSHLVFPSRLLDSGHVAAGVVDAPPSERQQSPPKRSATPYRIHAVLAPAIPISG